MIRLLPFILLIFSFSDSRGQIPISASADLSGAKQIFVNKSYSFASSPKGFGLLQEFPRDTKRSKFYFEQERNTVWLTIDIPFSGILTFQIKPYSNTDDYDWMLFENVPQLKELLKKGESELLRSNNSRNDPKIKGGTGMKDGAAQGFEAPGPGLSYSKPLLVKKGQKLAVIIDNIYGPGEGFEFISELMPVIRKERTLSGIITDKNTGRPINSVKIVCEDDSTGVRFHETYATANGMYKLTIPADRPINTTAIRKGYLFQTSDIEKTLGDTILDFALSPVAEGGKMLLFNIHFIPDKDLIMHNSESELDRLATFLKEETVWDVRIIGHTNNNPFADARYLQKLSFNRAIAVKQYLVRNGISEKRISCAGMGGKQPIALSEKRQEEWKNLRVEIVLKK